MSEVMEKVSVQQSPKSPSSPSNDNEKIIRYDRQLRLWGDHGQYCIENSNICLINATGLGTEVLKSLVLPGVGSFTIVDSGKVTDEDLGNNFFLDIDSIGRSRAGVSTQFLLEINPDVRGDYLEESLDSLIQTNPAFFTNFSVVIATNVWNEKTLIELSQILWKSNIPLILCYSYGFIGYVRVQIAEHTVVESHPDNVLEDLRLDHPFPELKSFLDANSDILSQKRQDIAHTPYLLILYSHLKKWRSLHNKSDNCLPANYKEKEELRKLIKETMRSVKEKAESEDDRDIDLQNFEEAIKATNTALVSSTYIPTETRKILDDAKANEVLSGKVKNAKFWLLVRALRLFMESKSNNCLPLRGSIPDMTADSQRYIALQKLYSSQAKHECDTLQACLQEICNNAETPMEMVSDSFVKLFCKNTHCLRVVKSSPISTEYSANSEKSENTVATIRQLINSSDLNGDGNSDLIFYLMLRAVIRFCTQYSRFPGYCSDQVESDILSLKTCFKEILNEFGFINLSKDDYIHEMCRYGGCELHSVSAFLGGCVAHEVIKLITGQYVPLNCTLIYNAMTSTSAAFNW